MSRILVGASCLLAAVALWAALPLLLSITIDTWLRWKYPLPSSQGGTPLPRARYTWPNGQGTEKFFNGRSAAREWRRHWGPMYQIWTGWTPEMYIHLTHGYPIYNVLNWLTHAANSVITTPSHAKQFFRTSHHHIKAANNNSGWLFGEVLGVCVGLLSGKDWKRVRAHVEEHFSHPSATTYTADFVALARGYLRTTFLAGAEQSSSVKGGVIVEPAKALQFFPFFGVAQTLFGPLSPEQKRQLEGLAPVREELFKEVIRGGINRLSIAPLLSSRGARLLEEFQGQWERFVGDAYEKAVGIDLASPPLVAGLWAAYKSGGITKRECLQTLDESLYANLDVTTHAISWNILLLAQHEWAQTELRKEVLAARENHLSQPYEKYIDREDTFLAACVLESSRLKPILPFSNPEAAPEDQYIDDYLIPRNTNVIVDSQAINIDNPFWINGKTYNPKRFAGLKKSDIRYNLWRFGFGPRQCLGKHVGERLLRAITAEIIRRYVISVPGGEKVEMGKLQSESWVGLSTARIECVLV
ncbi:cytochrome P450 monooxygenase gliC [Aspergillus stella-maris]|uniref:cytochrome P450 monooxygenase gliC n=1 Tax=Aspergillus stella-maris TaxID=1810926 RepID=UPI003CCCF7E1